MVPGGLGLSKHLSLTPRSRLNLADLSPGEPSLLPPFSLQAPSAVLAPHTCHQFAQAAKPQAVPPPKNHPLPLGASTLHSFTRAPPLDPQLTPASAIFWDQPPPPPLRLFRVAHSSAQTPLRLRG